MKEMISERVGSSFQHAIEMHRRSLGTWGNWVRLGIALVITLGMSRLLLETGGFKFGSLAFLIGSSFIYTGIIYKGSSNVILRIISWFSFFLIVGGLVFAFSSSDTLVTTGDLGSGVGFLLTSLVAVIGSILAFVGGFTTKPRFLGAAAIVISIFCVWSFYGVGSIGGLLFGAFPAIFLIGGGLLLTQKEQHSLSDKKWLIDGIGLLVLAAAFALFLGEWTNPFNLIAATLLGGLGMLAIYQSTKAEPSTQP